MYLFRQNREYCNEKNQIFIILPTHMAPIITKQIDHKKQVS